MTIITIDNAISPISLDHVVYIYSQLLHAFADQKQNC